MAMRHLRDCASLARNIPETHLTAYERSGQDSACGSHLRHVCEVKDERAVTSDERRHKLAL